LDKFQQTIRILSEFYNRKGYITLTKVPFIEILSEKDEPKILETGLTAQEEAFCEVWTAA
jgi:hypothetical protein